MKPMMFDDEIVILKELIKSLPFNSKIVEWGSGGSTVEILDNLRPDQKLVSIEHNKTWFDLVSEELKKRQSSSWEYLYKPEDPCFVHEFAEFNEENPMGLGEYIRPNENILDADLFFIDGIGRTTTALMLLAKAKNRNAVILIHDYRERAVFYDWIRRMFPKSEVLGTGLLRLYITA